MMTVCASMIGLSETELRQLEERLSQYSNVILGRRFSYYPEHAELRSFLLSADSDLLFVSTAEPKKMEATVSQASQILPRVQIVLVDSAGQPETLKTAMQLGVRECLNIPVSAADVRGAIERTLTRRAIVSPAPAGTERLYSFLPARGGVGSTTLATQTALKLPVDAAHRGLLIDADLDGGMIQFLLKIPAPPWVKHAENPHPLIEAMERAEQLEESLWSQLVTGQKHLDVMHAGESVGDYRPELARLQHVLAFSRRQYRAILVDLPAGFNRLSIELMQQSKAVFLVTTSEAASLHMARQRVRTLKDLQLGDRIRLVVNRVERKSGPPMDEVASIVGLPVDATFANDYTEVQKAIIAGTHLSSSCPLGGQLADFASSLFGDPNPAPAANKSFFTEIFALGRSWGISTELGRRN